jgi:cytochrome c peroxidase
VKLAILLAGAWALAGCLGDGRAGTGPGGRVIPDPAIDSTPPTPLVLAPPPGAWPAPESEANPLTLEGAALGEALFQDPILSLDSTLSCASCHRPQDAFSERGAPTSHGVLGMAGDRNAPALFNLAWAGLLFWDGRVANLEEQALHPVRAELEMALPWSEAERRLRALPTYRIAFQRAFPGAGIDSLQVARALAQYVRTLVSSGSRFDRWKRGEIELTDEERSGYDLLNSTATDCFHCHREPFFTSFAFHNIGLDSLIEGTGMGAVTGQPGTMGRWKTPSLRNLGFTAPYMHDGRFATLDEVLDFYESGGHFSPTLDPAIRNPDNPDAMVPGQKGLGLTKEQRLDLLAFLGALNDSAFAGRRPGGG